MATGNYFAASREVPLTEEEKQAWFNKRTREEWIEYWYKEQVPADTRLEWPNNVRKIEPEKFPPTIGEWKTIPARDGYEIPVLVYKPKRAGKTPVYFQIHGGGMTTGHPLTNDFECTLYNQRLDILVISIDYRLAPEYQYPIPLQDCYDVVQYCYDHADEWNIDVDHMGIGGCSSGAHFSIDLCVMAAQEKAPFKLRFLNLLYPGIDWFVIPDTSDDAIEANQMYINCYIDQAKEKDNPQCNPFAIPDEILRTFPSTLCLTAGGDWMSVSGKKFADKLIDNYVKVTSWCVEDAAHAFTIHFPASWDEERAPKAQEFILEAFQQYLL